MRYKIFARKWFQILICEVVLCAILVASAPLMGAHIWSQRSLQILIVAIALSAGFILYPRLKTSNIFSRKWLQILIIGILLFSLAIEVIRETNNIYFVPAALLLGAAVIPVTTIAFVYQHIQDKNISIPLLISCFCIGGSMGFVFTGFAEYPSWQNWTVPGLFGVGLAEESMKLLFPVVIFINWRFRHEADGLLYGAASGMGFAVLETMGDALNAFLTSSNVSSMQWVLFYRGLLSPAMHAAWTGLVCGALWRQRERTGRWLGITVILVFLLAVVLHALWNIIAYHFISVEHTPSQLAISAVEFLAVMSVNLGLVLWRFHKLRKVSDSTVYN